MTDQDIKRNIETALKSFSSGSFSKNALALFGALGYNTARQNPFVHKTTAEFEENFGHAFSEKNFNKEKARFDEWKSVDLLFQLSREELSGQHGLFDSHKINWEGEDERTVIETYLFFSIELAQPEYSRTELAQITREVNKIFPMPVMIIFRHGQNLTLSIIDRRLHKRDAQKDVLKKVTLIKDISIANPHRAHLEILFDLSLDELRHVHKFTNFVELHQAWQKTLDTKELNKRFYRELANWYFWAIKNVSFPNDVADDKDDTVFNSESVIRLLTRLIFIWFIKEKHLIPENIFDEKELKGMVKNFNTAGSTVYYRAILQNLFFATLNKKIEERAFATDGEFKQNIKHYGIKNLYRYSSDFNISKEAVMKMFAGVPFLNGGLFDCLDFEDEKGKVLYLDGFSRKPIKQAQVPDKLFFAREHSIDLSDVYDDKKKKNEKVKGLFEIFNHYKFTITENTPIEEEVALDPELLGRVFENLLASYNPETQTTARKQTGSFYTPREIVNYMVDESLKAYLKQNLETQAKMKPHDADAGLEILFTYTEKEHAFTGKETKTLIDAIDNCKILDPACGSGAFPMGILHKLVHILHKLDPQNEKWKERQISKARLLDDPAIREQAIADIEAAFTKNELDYGRKLYLIENCIYGVDIQPIATQISKLRFFISLIVDQKANQDKATNYGIRPLPNLETKFVAANTLIGLDKPQTGGQTSIENPEVKKLEDELKDLRHQYFNARTRTQKRTCQEKDKDLRKKIAEMLVKDGWNKDSARSVAAFDPYDQNASSPFFDPEWMYGITDGFDVVIGNPPYGADIDDFIKLFEKLYPKTSKGFKDIFKYFFNCSLSKLTRKNGVLCFITPNTFFLQPRFGDLRKYLLEYNILSLINLGEDVFEAVVPTAISIVKGSKASAKNQIKFADISDASKYSGSIDKLIYKLTEQSQFNATPNNIFTENIRTKKDDEQILENVLDMKDGGFKYQRINVGLSQKGNNDLAERLFYTGRKRNKSDINILIGKDINQGGFVLSPKEDKYLVGNYASVLRDNELVYYNKELMRAPTKLIWRQTAPYFIGCILEGNTWFGNTIQGGIVKEKYAKTISPLYLLGLLNSKFIRALYTNAVKETGRVFPQVKLEKLRPLPIKIVDKKIQLPIISIVEKIISKKKDNSDTSGLERQLNGMVYKLYELTDEEIAVIEGKPETSKR